MQILELKTHKGVHLRWILLFILTFGPGWQLCHIGSSSNVLRGEHSKVVTSVLVLKCFCLGIKIDFCSYVTGRRKSPILRTCFSGTGKYMTIMFLEKEVLFSAPNKHVLSRTTSWCFSWCLFLPTFLVGLLVFSPKPYLASLIYNSHWNQYLRTQPRDSNIGTLSNT